MTGAPRDAGARLAAATDLDANFVVAAGAGTGKTSLLVERVLQLVFSGRTVLSRIVALTFTEKAAAEMKHRVAESLLAASRRLSEARASGHPGIPADIPGEAGRVLARLAAEPLEVLERRARAGAEELDAVMIGTIHGFCADLLRRHPREVGLPPEFAVDDTGSGAAPFDEAWSSFLAAELGPGGSRESLWNRVFDAFELGQVRNLAEAVHRAPAVQDFLSGARPEPVDARDLFGDEARSLAEVLERDLPDVPARNKGFAAFSRTAISLLEAFRSGGPEAVAALDPAELEDAKFFRHSKPPSAGTDRNNTRKKAMEESAWAARTLLRDLRRIREAAVRDLLEALVPYAAAQRLRMFHDGVVSFDDLLLLARNLLRDDPGVRRHEAERFDAILVDEFQDTDPLQYEIVFFLAAAAEASGPDAYAMPLVPGRVFIVGDPKQSIYRFRGADMAAYHRAVEHGTAQGRTVSLTVNFRSRPEVLAPVNRLFADWIGENPDRRIDPAYEAVKAHRSADGRHGVEIWSVAASESRAEIRRRAEAEVLAREIRAWIDGSPGPDSPGEPAARPQEIALLFRALSDVPVYTRALRRAGVDFVVEGGKAFAERPEVVEAFAFLRALSNPGDPVPLLGVLRSAFGGVPDRELADHAASGGTFRWNEPGANAPPRVQGVFERLRELDALRQTLPLDRWVTSILTESEFLLGQAAYEDGPQRAANIRKLAEAVGALVRDRGLTLEEALLDLEEVFTGDRTEGESPLADEAIDAVRILSIHKAKGLEFPVVVLPDLARNAGHHPARTSARVFRSPAGPGLAVCIEGRGGVRNAMGSAAEREDARHKEAESKRLFYVATTRAKDRLVLVNSATRRLPPWVEALARLGYRADGAFPPPSRLDGEVVHRLLAPERFRAREEPPGEDAALRAHRHFLEVRAIAERSVAARFRNPSRDAREALVETADSEAAPVLPDRNLARAAGIAVHRLLERWDFRDPARLRSRIPAAADVASRETGAAPGRAREEVSRIVEGLLASALPAELASSEILAREIPVLRRDRHGRVVYGYADLVYRRDGRIRVADYKTDAETGAGRAREYGPQIEEYARAVQDALDLPELPLLEVLFVRTGERIAIEAERDSE